MTTFARKTFDVAGYLAFRPTYPAIAYSIVEAYHGTTGHFGKALDLGCGPGFVALNLAGKFKNVVALDPAQKMVDVGLQPKDPEVPRIDYKVGTAEALVGAGADLGLEDGVDLVVAGQAAHWFDAPQVWRQFTQLVRPGGTVAFIGYAEMQIPSFPQLNRLISHHSQDPTQLGPYWEPGRKTVEALLDPIPFPVRPTPPPSITLGLPGTPIPSLTLKPDAITEPLLPETGDNFDFSSWDPESAVRIKSIAQGGKPWLMTKRMSLSSLEGNFRTWSSLHAYHESHPEDAKKKGKGPKDGDIVDRLIGEIAKGIQDASPSASEETVDDFVVGWPLVLMMIKKKP